MRPIGYKGIKDNYTFIYKEDELAEFHKDGKTAGDAGCIITGFKSGLVERECYGTYEHPRTELVYLSMIPMKQLGEWMGDPDLLINPPESAFSSHPPETWRVDILDFGKTQTE